MEADHKQEKSKTQIKVANTSEKSILCQTEKKNSSGEMGKGVLKNNLKKSSPKDVPESEVGKKLFFL